MINFFNNNLLKPIDRTPIVLDIKHAYDNHNMYIEAIKKRDVDFVRKKINEGFSFWQNYMINSAQEIAL